MEHTDYEKQAQVFLAKTGTTFQAVLARNGKYFPDDSEPRDIYSITLRRGEGHYTFEFGQSLVRSRRWVQKERPTLKTLPYYRKAMSYEDWNPKGEWACKGIPPTPYDVLSTFTKTSPGLFEEFCMDFGYDLDSRRAEKVYRSVMDEWLHLTRLFSPAELEEMGEIS